jgi:sortase A
MRRRRHIVVVTVVAAVQIEAAVVALNARGAFSHQTPVRVLGVQVAATTPQPVPTPAPPKLPAERPARRVPAASGPVVQIGRIDIPKIGLSHPVYEGFTLREIDRGPSHYEPSAMPGHAGNTVFAGHRVTHSHPFLDIDSLAAGDQVIFTTAEGVFTYEVTDHLIVTPREVSILSPTPDATFTIFGCHPKHSARQRYVVRGRLVAGP